MEEQTGPGQSLVGPHRTSQKVKRSEKFHSKPYERPPVSAHGPGSMNGKIIGSERPHASDAHRLRRSASFVDSIRAMVTKPLSWLTGSYSSATNGMMLQSTSKTQSSPDRASETASTNAPEKAKAMPLSSSKLKLNLRSKRRTSDSPDGRSLEGDMVRSSKKARHTSPGSAAAITNGGMRGLRPSVSAPFLTTSSFPSHSPTPLIPVPPLPRLVTSTRSPTRAHLRASSIHFTRDASLPKPRSSLAADDQRMRTVSPYRSTPLGSPTRRTADGLGGFVIPSFEKAGSRELSSRRSNIPPIEGSAHAVFGGINGVTNFSMPFRSRAQSQSPFPSAQLPTIRRNSPPERDSTDKIFHALEEALPRSNARKLRKDQRATVRVPTPSGTRGKRGAGRVIRPYEWDEDNGEKDEVKTRKKLFANAMEKRKSNGTVRLSALLNTDTDIAKDKQKEGKELDESKKGVETVGLLPAASQETVRAPSPASPELASTELASSPDQSLSASAFIPLTASIVPPKSASSARPVSSLRAPRTRSRLMHEPSAGHRPNRFGMDAEGDGDHDEVDGGENEAAVLKEWARSKGIALEVPIGWNFASGTASSTTAPPTLVPDSTPAIEVNMTEEKKVTPAPFSKAMSSTLRSSIPVFTPASSAVAPNSTSDRTSKATTDAAPPGPQLSSSSLSTLVTGTLGSSSSFPPNEKPSPSFVASASSLVPPSSSGVPASKLPFSLMPPASSPVPMGPGGEPKLTDGETEEKREAEQEKPQSAAPPPLFAGFEMTPKPKEENAPIEPQSLMPTPATASTPASSFSVVPSVASDIPEPIQTNSLRSFGSFEIASVNGSDSISKPTPEFSSSQNPTPTPAPVEEPSTNSEKEPAILASLSSFGTTSTSPPEGEKTAGPTAGPGLPTSSRSSVFTFSAPPKTDGMEKPTSTSPFASVGSFSFGNPAALNSPFGQPASTMTKAAPLFSFGSPTASASAETRNKPDAAAAATVAASPFSFESTGDNQKRTAAFSFGTPPTTSTPTGGTSASLFGSSASSTSIAPAFTFGASEHRTPDPLGAASKSSTNGTTSFAFDGPARPKTPPRESTGDAGMDLSPVRLSTKHTPSSLSLPSTSSPFSFGGSQPTFSTAPTATSATPVFAFGSLASGVSNSFGSTAAPVSNPSSFAVANAAVDNNRPGTSDSTFSAPSNPFGPPTPAPGSPFGQPQALPSAFGTSPASTTPTAFTFTGGGAGFGISQQQPQHPTFGFTFQATPTASPTLSPTQGPVSSPPATFVFGGGEPSDPNKPPGTPTTPRRQVKALPNRRSTKR